MTITKAQITETFAPIIVNEFGFIPPSDFGYVDIIVLFDHGGSKQTVPVDTFYNFFKGATGMTAEAFHAVDNGKLGYGEFIDQWEEYGLFAGNYQPPVPEEPIIENPESPAE